jgi:hypothetical protein
MFEQSSCHNRSRGVVAAGSAGRKRPISLEKSVIAAAGLARNNDHAAPRNQDSI